jgi:regulator of replication initiation timing
MDNQEGKSLQEFAPKKESYNKTTILLIAIIGVMALALVYFLWSNTELKEEVEVTQKELNLAVLQLDSIGTELDKKILELQKLGADYSDLLVVKKELEEEKKRLLTTDQRNRTAIAQLKDKVAGYEELLHLKDAEIKKLKTQNEQLYTENTALKTEKNQLTDSIRTLAVKEAQLTEKVAIASRLQLRGLKVYAVNDKDKEREGEFRNRHIGKIRIEFGVAENKVAPIEGKDLLIRVIGPDNQVLFDVTRGSGTFMFEGREMFFTVKKEILYDRSAQTVSVLYEKGSDYALGLHTVEVYTDDYLMGKGTFVVK